jgi:hypothetical protein
VEAESAIALFEHHRDRLIAILEQTGSGRELEQRGHVREKPLASDLDVSTCVARFDGLAFVAM